MQGTQLLHGRNSKWIHSQKEQQLPQTKTSCKRAEFQFYTPWDHPTSSSRSRDSTCSSKWSYHQYSGCHSHSTPSVAEKEFYTSQGSYTKAFNQIHQRCTSEQIRTSRIKILRIDIISTQRHSIRAGQYLQRKGDVAISTIDHDILERIQDFLKWQSSVFVNWLLGTISVNQLTHRLVNCVKPCWQALMILTQTNLLIDNCCQCYSHIL